jgi:hypothetical protein
MVFLASIPLSLIAFLALMQFDYLHPLDLRSDAKSMVILCTLLYLRLARCATRGYIVTHPEVVDEAAARFERWFAGREEVDIVDVGTSDKMGLGVILMEWSECDVDPLFLAILNDEEAIADFTLFARTLS